MPESRWKSFEAFDSEQWLEAVGDARNVPNATWDQPIWSANLAPFALPARGIAPPEEGNPWQLQQSIKSHREIIPALMHGASGLRLDLESSGCDMNWLEGVHLDMVELHIDPVLFQNGALDVLSLLDSGWCGTCCLEVDQAITDKEWNDHQRLFADAPDLRIWKFGIEDHRNRALNLVQAMVGYCASMDVWLQKCMASNAPLEQELNRFVWRWWTSVDVMEEVAALRALRALWSRWLKEHKLEVRPIWIDATTSIASFRDELESDHLIDLTAASYAAVIGGADGLETLPYLAKEGNETQRDSPLRWARNIQHLMREEAGLHRTFDPMGGSRTLDTWSSNMLEAAWSSYLNTKA